MKLEVGMYVRTTYGIGKIVSAYIVYAGNYFGKLAYMTDNPKIEIDIYTKKDSYELFGKVQENSNIDYEAIDNNINLANKIYEQKLEVVCYVPVNYKVPTNAELFDNHKFVNASHNVIELIEVGDLITYDMVTGLSVITHEKVLVTENLLKIVKILKIDNTLIVKQILTKEQFNNGAYELEI